MKMKIGAAAALVLCAATLAAADEAETVFKKSIPSFSITTYAGLGAGVSVPSGDAVPLLEASSGFQFAPWIAVGGFGAVNPLSDFEDADLGLSTADTEAAYAYMSGTEILLTPWAHKVIHPLVRATVGGVTAGYLVEMDDEEGYDAAVEERFFFASLSAGAEINLSRHLRLGLRGGWRFAGNDKIMGISAGGLSGPEAALTLRVLWRTVFD